MTIKINFENKIIPANELNSRLGQIQCVRPLVFTNGCFDILHRGHVTYLAQAKQLGSKLVVALNSDASVKRLGKADNRPINNLGNRMAVIAALESVDYVVSFDADTPLELILLIKPDILVKGGDWAVNKIVGSKEVLAYGGQVYSIPFEFDTSTTKVINAITSGAR